MRASFFQVALAIKNLLNQSITLNTYIKWDVFIQNFYPMIQYQHGRTNVVIDDLSHRSQETLAIHDSTFAFDML